ncbi:GNAT family N-acetyltransferase [Patulibacter sp.]|uniref:GNAT family N-acetyltransferase n=1 Tax=Patulibacter sp. TaxID=1912859 RepID=UPI0027209EF1|nr:GNAT family N-acetyltransferase [Patulibacter sp.]MDO9409844.1 GNAT family N-acetyltransferase [Patulibacter sp.]
MQGTAGRSDDWWAELTIGHAAGVVRARAADARRTPFGWMLQTPAAPHVWAVNRAQVIPGAGGLDAADTVTAVEAAHDAAGLAHRAIDVRSKGDARRLGAVLRAAGYVVQELEVLVAEPGALSTATRPRPGRRWAVAPYGPGAGLDVRRAAGAMETSRSEREREEVATQWSLAPAEGAAHLVARSDVGEAVGCAVVHRASLHLELDDVLTHPAHERSGVGAAILRATAAMALDRGVAGITLLADPNSYAAGWYRRLGFRHVGGTTQAHRDAAD